MKEGKDVRRRFPAFMHFERSFNRAYRFNNPFQLCKTHLKTVGEKNVDAYGETPIPALAQIAEECGLCREDFLIELGCGRGRGSLFLSHLLGCRVLGIDWVSFFIDTANRLVENLPVTFECKDMVTADLTGATAIYLCGTCLPDPTIAALIHRFEALSPLTKIITVSYPLSDYSSNFRTFKQFSVLFPWGEADVFLNLKREE